MREGHAVAVIRDQMIREPEFEIEIRTLVNKMPALQSLFVDDGKVKAVKFIERVVESRGIERRPELTKRIMLRFVKQRRVTPEFFSQLVFQQRLEIVFLLCAQAELIETITDVAGKQLVCSFAGKDDGDAGRFRSFR